MCRRVCCFLAFLFLFSSNAFSGAVIQLQPGPNMHARAQEAMIMAQPGTTIIFPAGKFQLEDELILTQSHVTLKGQGMDKTILNFKNQISGAQGILATGNAFTIEDMAIEDTSGDALKVTGADGVVIRRVRVEWTNGPSSKNGAYGLYPVQCKNVLIEDSVAIAAADAGIYVGQSSNIIVRRNLAKHNVAGIEIENSKYADVYDNIATENTGGILVFDLPNLKIKGGRQVRIFRNKIHNNNTKNFAPKGNIVGIIPPGTGFMVMANDDIEIFENTFTKNKTGDIAIINYLITENEITDPDYDPKPERIHIHHNTFDKRKRRLPNKSEMSILISLLFKFKIPHIVYDGIEDGTYEGTPLPRDRKICINNNKTKKGKKVTFGNMHLDNQRRFRPWPGGPVTKSKKPHACAHDALPKIVLADFPAMPQVPIPPTQEEINRVCKADGEGINTAALEYDCPDRGDYRLQDGIPYDLTTPLFTDYARKKRVIYIPKGKAAMYNPDHAFEFPVGTVIQKDFAMARDLRDPNSRLRPIESRLLIHRKIGWVGLPYEFKKNAGFQLAIGGGGRDLNIVDQNGNDKYIKYRIPSKNQCISCHGVAGKSLPIGPKAKWLNKDFDYYHGQEKIIQNQLVHWKNLGVLSKLPNDFHKVPRQPVWNDPSDGSLEERAKSYLGINCAHCHNPTGIARFSGLMLETFRDVESTEYGNCKPPVAAGSGAGKLKFDVVPGKAKKSILFYRLSSSQPGVKMPEVGRSLVHKKGAALIKAWIDSMPKKKCR